MVNIALIIFYVLIASDLLYGAYKHGDDKEGVHDFWTTLISKAILLTLILWAVGWRFI